MICPNCLRERTDKEVIPALKSAKTTRGNVMQCPECKYEYQTNLVKEGDFITKTVLKLVWPTRKGNA